MKPTDVAVSLRDGYHTLLEKHGKLLDKHGITTVHLLNYIDRFEETAKNFEARAEKVDRNNPLAVRLLNDQILLLERAFIDDAGIPRRPWQKNVIFGTNVESEYSGWTYPGVLEALYDFDYADDKEQRLKEAKMQISVVSFAINSATTILRDVSMF